MRRRYLFGLLVATAVVVAIMLLWPDVRSGRTGSGPWSDPLVERDLDVILHDTLRVLVIEHHLTYEHMPGAETGLEYELLERFAKQIGVPVRAVVVDRSDNLLPMLQRGEGDVIAAQLAKRSPIERWIACTVPYRFVSPMITTLRADRALGISDHSALSQGSPPDSVWVSACSPFAPAEHRFPGNDGGANLNTRTVFTDTSRFGDDPVINVALGRMRAAVISDAEAVHFADRFPQLAFAEAPDVPVPLVFGVRTNARQLLRALDRRLNDPHEKEAMALLMSAYGSRLPHREPMSEEPFAAASLDSLLPLEDKLREQVERRHRDWELLAAIAFRETRTANTGPTENGTEDPLPMMPNTAQRVDDDAADRVDAQIRAAARYLSALDTIWSRSIPDPDQRLRFVVAAYHAGPGHVVDAQTLAARSRLDPQRWEGHVERALTLLALPRFFREREVKSGPWKGDQTFTYVRDVVGLYDHYRSAARTVTALKGAVGH